MLEIKFIPQGKKTTLYAWGHLPSYFFNYKCRTNSFKDQHELCISIVMPNNTVSNYKMMD